MNVKPGDLARVVRGDYQQLIGVQVYVEGEVPVGSLEELLMLASNMARHGQLWDCRFLESRFWKHPYAHCSGHVLKAGNTYAIPDAWLERIVPPADTDELLRETLLPHEEQPLQQPKKVSANATS
jgi:hypothetical protein